METTAAGATESPARAGLSYHVPVKQASPEPAAGDRAARALWIALVLLAAARALLAFAPGMWLWGANGLRFAPPAVGWTLWTLAALALIPAAAARATPTVKAAGDAIARGGLRVALLAALGAALLVWFLPDRVQFVGDALLRQGAVEFLQNPGGLAPGGAGQVLPIDLFLHFTLPRALQGAGLMSVETSARLLGAFEAALLALLAIAFARALALGGSAALVGAAVVFFGGELGLFTGYDKSYTELCLVTAAVAVCALRVVRQGRGRAGLGAAVAAGLLLHRSSLALLPAAGLAWWFALRARGRSVSRADWALGLALPALVLAFVLVPILHTVRVLDAPFHLAGPRATPVAGGQATLWEARLADLASFCVLLSPVSLATPVLLGVERGRLARRAELWMLIALFLPFAALTVMLTPRQGLYRDWDVFAAGGLALSLLTAWLAAEVVARHRRNAWLGVAVAAAVTAPSLEWLVIHTDFDRGLRRAEAFATEPPPRGDAARAATWDYLGTRNFRSDHFEESVAAFRRAVEISPSARMLYTLATAEQMAGHLREAQTHYRGSTERDPQAFPAWLRLAQVSNQLGDLDEAWRAAREMTRLTPDDPRTQRAFARIDSLRRARSATPPAPR